VSHLPEVPRLRALEDVVREYVLHALRVVDGNRSRVARELGMDRRTLYRKLDRWREQGFEIPESRT
jgi:DNA-binding NtrC family response regulator